LSGADYAGQALQLARFCAGWGNAQFPRHWRRRFATNAGSIRRQAAHRYVAREYGEFWGLRWRDVGYRSIWSFLFPSCWLAPGCWPIRSNP